MPTPSKGPRLGGGPAHERLMLANLAAQLFEHKRITTTVTKAKRLKPYAERLVTFAKRGDLASRRRVLGLISDKGNNAPMAVIELVLEPLSAKQAVVAEATQAAEKAAPAEEAAVEAPAEETTEVVEETVEAPAAEEATEEAAEEKDAK